jgi:uncharacterized protein (DUF1499 family)
MKQTALLLILFALPIMTEISSANSNTVTTCPNKPNCVSSLAVDANQIAPFELIINTQQTTDIAWLGISNIIKKQHRTNIISFNATQLHAEVRSIIFKFVDDLNLSLDSEQNIVHVRSASRTGYYDFGVNRQRIESLRSKLKKAGLIQ